MFVTVPVAYGLGWMSGPATNIVHAQQVLQPAASGPKPVAVSPVGFGVSPRVADLPPAIARKDANAVPRVRIVPLGTSRAAAEGIGGGDRDEALQEAIPPRSLTSA